MKTKNLILFFGILLLSFGCSDENALLKGGEDDENIVYPIDITTTEFVLPANCKWQNLKLDSVYVINSQEKLSQYVSGTVDIDFEKYSLMVIADVNTSGIESISTEMQQTANDKYTLNIIIKSNDASVMEKWNVAKLVPKISENADIEVNTHIDIAECDWKPVSALQISNQLQLKLNGIFSILNEKMNTIEGDTLLFVIDNQKDIENLQPYSEFTDIWTQIDWTTQCIVWGRILTTSISDSISTKQLFECGNDLYKYNIQIEKCTDCWTAAGRHYFWGVYPRKISQDNISLTIK